MGSAFKNKGVQPLLDGVVDYLPDPTQVTNVALNQAKNEEPTTLQIDPKKPFVGLAFKLQATQFGQITYMRIYQGTLSKGKVIYNTATNKKQKVPRLIRMHRAEMEDVTSLGPGEIGALFGVECESGTTFTESNQHLLTMTSMHIPEPVISLALRPKDPD
jgi:elongation factor G